MSSQELVAALRLGIVGCGGARQNYGPILGLMPGLTVTALMDTDMVAARAWARLAGRPQVFTEFDAFLAEAPVDIVLIASPVAFRCEQSLQAAEAGKRVLCEKPIARSLLEGERMRGALAPGCLFMPAFVKRFDPTLQRAKRWMEAGEIGQPLQIRCDWSFYEGWSERRQILTTWRGIFEENATQTIDLCRWWLGEVLTVSADIDIERESARSGQIANLILNHERGVSVHHISRTGSKNASEKYHIKGTEGSLHIELGTGANQETLESYRMTLDRSGASPVDLTPERFPRREDDLRQNNPYKLLLDHALEAIRARTPSSLSVEDGYHTLEILHAAHLSSLDKVKITLPLPSPNLNSGVFQG